VRRLIEAASRSRTIANLRTTPGLNLQAWQDQIIGTTRERVGKMRGGLSDLRLLLRASVYADKGPGIDELIAAASARTAIGPSSIRLAIGTDNIEQTTGPAHHRAGQVFWQCRHRRAACPRRAASAAGRARSRTIALAKVRKDVQEALRSWGRARYRTSAKLRRWRSLDGIAPALTKLEAVVADVRGVFARFPWPGRKVSLDVGDLPLYATVDLTRELRATAAALATLDDGLRAVFPGEVPARLRFARTSTARLIAFLDLMQRVARQSPLSMRSGDVIAALRTLGTYRSRASTRRSTTCSSRCSTRSRPTSR
jgi:hypothetical protein